MGRIIWSMFFAAGALVGTASYGKVEVSHKGDRTIYDITIDGVDLKPVNVRGMKFVKANFRGVDDYSAVRRDLGKPEVPVVRLLLDGKVSVEPIGDKMSRKLLSTLPIMPSQPSWNKSMKFAPPISYDAASYSTKSGSGTTLEAAYEITPAGSVRGVTRNLVTLNAMSYNASTGAYQLQSKYRVTVVNKRLDAEILPPTIAFVVGARFTSSPALATLVQLKATQGYNIKKIIIGQGGVTTDESVRAALKAIYAENINLRFAILVGDVADVPSHEATHITGVTDHFYRAIDTSDYETDINGPDIGVGRLSVASEAQLAVVVGKIARYRDGRFAANQWMQHPAFVTTHDRFEVAEGTHNFVIEKYFAPLNYDREFPDSIGKGGDKLFPVTLNATSEQIVEHMNRGRFIINFSGHGSNSGWEDVTTPDVESLSDPSALPWVIANACITGDFRVESVFGETWLRHPNGAIVYFGSMDSSFWDEDDFLEKGMYKAVFEAGVRTFDDIHQAALSSVWQQYGGLKNSAYYWETYVTFGDPSLELRLGKSEEATVEGPTVLVIGAAEATWKISSSKGPEKFATIALHRASDGKSVSGKTDANGELTLSLAEFGGGIEALTLTVVGGDLQSVARPIQMIAPNQAYLGFSGWQVNGRANSDIHVGEVIRLGTTVENFGGIATHGGHLRIASMTGPATANVSEAFVPALGSRQNQTLPPALTFTVSNTALRGDSIRVTFVWETDEGQTGTFSKSWPVVKADLSIENIDYGDSRIEGVGADGLVYLTVKNIGTEVLNAASITGRAGTCTTSVDGNLELPDLVPGASARVATPFHVYTDGQCASGSYGLFTVEGTYQSEAARLNISSSTQYQIGVVKSEVERATGMALPIPDVGAAVIKTIPIAGSGSIKDISVYVNIHHKYVGDLVINLISPSGRAVTIRSQVGGSDDDVDQRYGRGGIEVPGLAAFMGTEVHGDWGVSVQDLAASDFGVFDAVELAIRHW